MFKDDLIEKKQLTAYLVGIRRKEDSLRDAEEHLEELTRLCETMGLDVAGSEIVSLGKPSAAMLLGSGKVEELKATAEMNGAELIVLDDELSPGQQRNWEKETDLAVIDRMEVILEIFRQRAQTREARLQVDLAKLEYSLPRLKRAWTHLERQRGGGGFIGGAGEAQIEVDRRLVRDAIARCKRELKEVRRQRATQRKSRKTRPTPSGAIVGYTNSGKSTLLNRLTGAHVLAEDKLFATLDPTTRRIILPNNQPLLLTDTVGFIRKLPHQLVEAFMATLEESQQADFLVHVLDASHPAVLEQLRATNTVLEELGIDNKPVVHVLNKMDQVEDPLALAELRHAAEPNVCTSMLRGEGVGELLDVFAGLASGGLQIIRVRLPASRSDLISMMHREGHILTQRYDGEESLIEAELPVRYHDRFGSYLAAEEDFAAASGGEAGS